MRKIIISILILMFVLVFSTVAAGCKEQAPAVEEATVSEDETVEEAAEGEIVLAMIGRDQADPYHVVMSDGGQEECEKRGVEFILKDSQNDLSLQLNIADNLISLGVDGVAINVVDGSGSIPAIEAFNKAGIPVAGFDTIANGGECIVEVGVDNFLASQKAGEALIQALKDKNNGEVPEGVVLNIMGSVNMQIGVDRSEGFHKALEEYPQLTIAEAEGHWNPDDAYKATSDLATKHSGEIVGVFTAAGIMSAGIVSALENEGYDLTKIPFTNIDGDVLDMELIKQGKLYSCVTMSATKNGAWPIEFLYYAAMGMTDKLPKVGDVIEGIEVKQGVTGPSLALPLKLCPQEISPDDPSIFGNIMLEKEKQGQ